MGLLWKFRRQQVVQESGNGDTCLVVVDQGRLEAFTPGCFSCDPSGIYVYLDCHDRGCFSLGSFSGDIIQGSREPTCRRCELLDVDRPRLTLSI